MRTWDDATGTWTTVDVRAGSRDEARRAARSAVRREGYRVEDVASAVRQPEGHHWSVECRVARRVAT